MSNNLVNELSNLNRESVRTPSVPIDEMHVQQEEKALDSVQKLKSRLRPIVMRQGAVHTEWENALYALILAKEPGAQLHTILAAMPFRHNMLDKLDALNVMANLNYFSRAFKSKLTNLDARLYPCVIEPKSDKEDIYVVLGRTQDGWHAYNASQGCYETIEEYGLLASRTYTIYFFKPFDESKVNTSQFIRGITGHSWFMAVLSRFKSTFAQVFLTGFILNIFALAPPVFIMMIYDRVLGSESSDTLFMLAMGMAMALYIEWSLRRLRSQSLSWLTARLDNIVGNRIFAHMLNLTPQYIENASVTGQIARIRTFESARDFFSGGVFLSAIEIPFTILSLIIIYAIAGWLVLVPAGMAIVLMVSFVILRRIQILQIRKSARAGTVRQQFILETMESIATIKSNGMFNLWFQKFRQLSGRDATSHFRMQWLGSIAETVTQSLSMISLVLLVGFGTQLIWSGDMSTGGLVASMILIWRVLGPFQSLCLSIPRIEQLRGSIQQVNQLMELEGEENVAAKVSKLPQIKGRITFENVSMKYDAGSNFVYKDLSFDLQAGQAMAVTGPAGTGKSTLFKLIQGMYQIDNGFLRIDGFDIRQLDVHDIRRQISYIPQVHDFYQGSIIDNIRVSNPLATYDEVEQALEFSGATDDIAALPNGLDTPLFGEGIQYISPSFSFKLALCRMHVQVAPIVLIDELPNQFQEGDIGSLLYRSIDRLRGKRTIIFVTFRKDYLALSDWILTFNADKSYKLEPVDVLFQ